MPQVDRGSRGREREGFRGPAFGTGVGGRWAGISIKKTLWTSQTITDEGGTVGTPGSCPRNGGYRARWKVGKLGERRLVEALTARLRHLPVTLWAVGSH